MTYRLLPATLTATLIVGAALVIFGERTARAEADVEAMVRVYNDSETLVISPHARVSASVGHDSVVLGAGYAEDVVTSSSTDVRSWSSKGTISDLRREESGDVTFNLQNGSVTGYYIQSDENDYHSQTYGLSTTRDFFQKNTTLDLGVGLGIDNVQNDRELGYNAYLTHQSVTLGVTQVFSPVSIAQILYDFNAESGYLSGPYRVARLDQGDGTVIGIPENSPASRIRNSLAFKYNHFFRSINSSLASTLRIYYDTWDVKSATIEERLSHDYGKHFSMTYNVRFYQQGQASFYQDKYNPNNLPVFFTGNKTLANYFTGLAGIRPEWHIGSGDWDTYVKVEYYIERFSNFTDVGNPTIASDDKLYSINALILGAGFSGKF